VRKYRDNPAANGRQLWNAAKYSCSILTTLLSLLNKNFPNTAFRPVWITVAACTALYTYSWDVYCDWGFLRFESGAYTPKLLRRKLVLNNHFPYYFAIVSNLALRAAWVLTISPTGFGLNLRTDVFNTLIWTAEILRRNQWNFYRLENEHLTNCENYRVVNIVPLKIMAAPTNHAEEAAAAGGGGSGGSSERSVRKSSRRDRDRSQTFHTRPAAVDEEMGGEGPRSPLLRHSRLGSPGGSGFPDDSGGGDPLHVGFAGALTAPDARNMDPDRHDDPEMHDATFVTKEEEEEEEEAQQQRQLEADLQQMRLAQLERDNARHDALYGSSKDLAILERAPTTAGGQDEMKENHLAESISAMKIHLDHPSPSSGGVNKTPLLHARSVSAHQRPTSSLAWRVPSKEARSHRGSRTNLTDPAAGGDEADRDVDTEEAQFRPGLHLSNLQSTDPLAAKRPTPQSTPLLSGLLPSAPPVMSSAGQAASPLVLPAPMMLRTTSDPTTAVSPPQQDQARTLLTAMQTGAASDGVPAGPLSDTAIQQLNQATLPHFQPAVSLDSSLRAQQQSRSRPPSPSKPSFDPMSSIVHRSRRLSFSHQRRPIDAESQIEEDDQMRSREYGNPTASTPDGAAGVKAESPSSRTAAGPRSGSLSPSPRELRDEHADAALNASMSHADDMFDRVLARRKSITSSRATPASAMRALAQVVGEDMVAHALSLHSPHHLPVQRHRSPLHTSGARSPPHHHHHTVTSSAHPKYVHPASSHTVGSVFSPLALANASHSAASSPRPVGLSARAHSGGSHHHHNDSMVPMHHAATAQNLARSEAAHTTPASAAHLNDLEADLQQQQP
jgi:hypothetical protein